MTIHLSYFPANRGQESSMKKWWFNSMLSKKGLEHGCGLSKSMESLCPIENTSNGEDPSLNDTEKNIHSWRNGDSSSYSNADHLVRVMDIRNFISDHTFLLRNSKGDRYSIYLDIENQIFEIDNDHSFLNYSNSNSSYQNTRSKSGDPYNERSLDDTQYSYGWNNHINNCIDSYLHSQIGIGSSLLSGSDNYSGSSILSYILSERGNIRTITDDSNLTHEGESSNHEGDQEGDHEGESSNHEGDQEGDHEGESSNHEGDQEGDQEGESSNHEGDQEGDQEGDDGTQKYRHLWVQCENCYGLNYKKFFKAKMNICEECGSHLKMNSSDRIELLIDENTWNSMDEDMVSIDPIEFHSEDEPYKDRIDSYQRETGLTEAVQTGIGQLNGIPVAMGVMDFQFMGGSMGSVVGEKITRLIEYATQKSLPLIIVCASGGARMQEGSLSLMQMAKISSVLYDFQLKKKLFYVSILTSPTTGGVTASFGMLGDIIIAEPNAYIAFAGKRVIEQTLNTTVPEGSQEAEPLFDKGLFDLIVPRNLLKGVLSELFQLHAFFPLNQNQTEY